MNDIVKMLREAAEQIAKGGHDGWGNLCTMAADEIERLREYEWMYKDLQKRCQLWSGYRMSHIQKLFDAMTYDGGSRVKRAWLMAVATYAYTRAHDGSVVNDAGERINFGRWYCFCGAVENFWDYLWRP